MSTDLQSYLRDLSRRILQRGGMEQVLYKKSRSKDPRYQAHTAPPIELERYFSGMATDLKNDSTRSLFLGVGLVAGRVQSPGRWSPTKRVAGPLVYCPVELGGEDTTEAPECRVAWDEATLNYDLLTVLLQNVDEETEETDWRPQGSLSVGELEALRSAETLIETLEASAPEGAAEVAGLVGKVLRILSDSAVAFKCITIGPDPFVFRTLNHWVEADNLTAFDHAFFFLAPVPDQLSSTVALRRLIREVKTDGHAASHIGAIVEAALLGTRAEVPSPAVDEESVREAIDRLPLSLSARQCDAIARALASPLSFVQGPPGTGKSHTITAMMLTAARLHKSVLMVSHKEPAVDVVWRKLNELLGDAAVIRLGPEPAKRRAIQATLNHWLSQLGRFDRSSRLRKTSDRARQVEQRLWEARTEERRHLWDLQHTLAIEHDYFQTNQRLVELRDAFCAAFGLDRSVLDRIVEHAKPHPGLGPALEALRRVLDPSRGG